MEKQYKSPEIYIADYSAGKGMTEIDFSRTALWEHELNCPHCGFDLLKKNYGRDDLMGELKEVKTQNSLDDDAYYQASDQLVERNIVGETVLVPVGDLAQNLNGFATFSETGEFLWNLLSRQKCSEDDLVIALSEEYHCPKEKVKEDVRHFLIKMLDRGFIVKC